MPLLFIGGSEIIVIILVILLLFGTKGIADVAKTVGKSMGEFKKVSEELKGEIKRSSDDPLHTANDNHPANPPDSEKTEYQ